jgi:hypothetical protein
VVDDLADRLGQLARIPSCPRPLDEVLLAWRDRLSSYALTGRALTEADLSGEDVRRLLERGVDEVLAEAPQRTRQARDKLAVLLADRRQPVTP